MKSVNLIRLELKYCENCGGLWLRRRGERLPHCHRCRQICSKKTESDQAGINQDVRSAYEMAEEFMP